MKRVFLICLLSLPPFAGWAQNSKSDVLVKTAWKIRSDEMSGIGVHTSLPKESELQFSADGTWKSSHPFREASNGKWRLENNDHTLVISSGNDETRYSILQLTKTELQMRLKKNAATYTYKWLSKE